MSLNDKKFLDIIGPCKGSKPNPENCANWSAPYIDNRTKQLYEICEDEWCKTCNEVYHEACESIFENIKLTFPGLKKNDLTKILKKVEALSYENPKNDIEKQNFVDRNGLFMKLNSCHKYREKHHDSCIRNFKTKKIGPDSGHDHILNEIKYVGNKASENFFNINKGLKKSEKFKFKGTSFRSSRKQKILKNRGKR